LRNPIYAGTYVYGRTKTKTKIVREDGELPKARKYQQQLKRVDWEIVINDTHPGYITWQDFLDNEEQLQSNRFLPGEGIHGAARSGCSLLQGMLHCGSCRKSMRVKYRHGRATPYYICESAKKLFGKETCQAMPGAGVDQEVERLFLEAIKPAQIEISLKDLERVEEQSLEVNRQVALRIKKAETEADEAEKRLKAADYTNKYAFDCLQEDLKKKKEEVAKLKRKQAKEKGFSIKQLTPEERLGVLALANDLPQIWQATTTSVVTRKNLLRCLINDVTLKREGNTVDVGVRWKTGAKSELKVIVPKPGGARKISDRTLEFIRHMVTGHTNCQIAEALNRAGILNSKGQPFTRRAVKNIRYRFGIVKHPRSNKEHGKGRRRGALSATR
jgi:hypothetical protein